MNQEADRRRELAAYRWRQADEALDEARLMSEASHYRASVNRSYYAMFYGLLALIVTRGGEVRSHGGAIAFFDREFVKTSELDKRFSKWLHAAFDLRQEVDYGDMVEIGREEAEETLEHARAFLTEIKPH